MKKISLFLSVAWLAMAAVSFETHAGTVSAPESSSKPGLIAKFGGLFKKTPTAPVITSASTVEEAPAEKPVVGAGVAKGVGIESPVAAAPAAAKRSLFGFRRGRSNSAPEAVGAAVAPLAQATVTSKAAEAEDAYDLRKSITSLESTEDKQISGFKNLLSTVGKNRLGSAFSSSKKCRTWGGYRAELVAGRDFYGSNCAIEFCSQYCAPVTPKAFWAQNTLGETVCALRCARGVSMGDSNARLKAAYDATKGRDVWGDALTHWQGLEGTSVVTADNLVNANAADAVRSAKAIAAYKGAVKAAANSTSPATDNAKKSYTTAVNAFIKAVAELVSAEQAAIKTFEAKTKAVEDASKKALEEAESASRLISVEELKSLFFNAREASFAKMKESPARTAVSGLTHGEVQNTLGTLTKKIFGSLKKVLKQGEDSIATVEQAAAETAPQSLAPEDQVVRGPAFASSGSTTIEAALKAIVNGGTTGNARSKARKAFIDQHTDKAALKGALLALSKKGGVLGKEAGAMLNRAELKDVVVQ